MIVPLVPLYVGLVEAGAVAAGAGAEVAGGVTTTGVDGFATGFTGVGAGLVVGFVETFAAAGSLWSVTTRTWFVSNVSVRDSGL